MTNEGRAQRVRIPCDVQAEGFVLEPDEVDKHLASEHS